MREVSEVWREECRPMFHPQKAGAPKGICRAPRRRKNVAASVDRISAKLFRGHVGDSAAGAVLSGRAAGQSFAVSLDVRSRSARRVARPKSKILTRAFASSMIFAGLTSR